MNYNMGNPHAPFYALQNPHIDSIKEEDAPSFYETIQIPLADGLDMKVCELLGLDPDTTNSITLEADGRINGASVGTVMTVRRVKAEYQKDKK